MTKHFINIFPNILSAGISLPCEAGYICLKGSNTGTPADGVMGFICPAGHYCLAGAITAALCDKGTYGPKDGLGKIFLLIFNLYYCYFYKRLGLVPSFMCSCEEAEQTTEQVIQDCINLQQMREIPGLLQQLSRRRCMAPEVICKEQYHS